MKKLLALSVILTLFISTPSFAEAIGHVKTVDGEANIILMDGTLALELNDEIQLNDIIETNDNSSIVIEFIDQTILALGADTRLEIDEYIFDSETTKSNKAVFSVTKGPFHYISGLIAKIDKPDVTLNLDFGSIGVRGTKVWRDMNLTDDGKQQCRIYVEDGSARVYNELGFTTLRHGDGSKIAGHKSPPTTSKPWGEKAILDIKSKSPIINTPEKLREGTPDTPDESIPEILQEEKKQGAAELPQNILEEKSETLLDLPPIETPPEPAE